MVKKLISLVNPGVGETRASPCFPASMFSREDLPTFDLPMKANSGNDSSGQESRSGALRSKMADEMFKHIDCRSESSSPIEPIFGNPSCGHIAGKTGDG